MWERRLIGYSKIDGGWGDTPTYVGKTPAKPAILLGFIFKTPFWYLFNNILYQIGLYVKIQN